MIDMRNIHYEGDLRKFLTLKFKYRSFSTQIFPNLRYKLPVLLWSYEKDFTCLQVQGY